MVVKTHIPEKFTGIIQLSPSDETDLKKLQDFVISIFPDQKRIGKFEVSIQRLAIENLIDQITL